MVVVVVVVDVDKRLGIRSGKNGGNFQSRSRDRYSIYPQDTGNDLLLGQLDKLQFLTESTEPVSWPLSSPYRHVLPWQPGDTLMLCWSVFPRRPSVSGNVAIGVSHLQWTRGLVDTLDLQSGWTLSILQILITIYFASSLGNFFPVGPSKDFCAPCTGFISISPCCSSLAAL